MSSHPCWISRIYWRQRYTNTWRQTSISSIRRQYYSKRDMDSWDSLLDSYSLSDFRSTDSSL